MRILSTVLLLPALSAAAAQELDWLVGCWITPDGSAQEVWVAEGDGSLAGFSVSVVNGKVGFYEVLSIVRNEDGALVYTAHPVGQATASFTASAVGKNSVLFENADHDYPQQIRYTREANRLHATISLLDGSRPVSFDKVACD